MTGIAAARLPASGQRQPDREGRQGRRLDADRPELHRATAISTAGRRRPRHRSERSDQDRAGALQCRELGGSNLGPTSKALIDRVTEDVDKLQGRKSRPSPIPVDLVTTSASGLDPHISPAAALFQVPRVAKARGLSEDAGARSWSRHHTRAAILGFLGEPRVNVLQLNLALDALQMHRLDRQRLRRAALNGVSCIVRTCA